MPKKAITYERATQLFLLDFEEGVLYWKIQRHGPSKIGGRAGGLGTCGYMVVTADSQRYKTHRIIWLLKYGYLPECEIDHIDRNKLNNSISNLRLAPNNGADNMQNKNTYKNNASGVPGVWWRKEISKWRVFISIGGKRIWIGNYEDFFEAVCVRKSTEIKYFTFVHSGV